MPTPSFWLKATSRVGSARGLSFPVHFQTSYRRAHPPVRDSRQLVPDLDQSQAALRSFLLGEDPPGCGAGEHLASGKWLLISFHSTSGPAWSRAGAEIWTPSHFIMATRWAPGLFGKRSRAI